MTDGPHPIPVVQKSQPETGDMDPAVQQCSAPTVTRMKEATRAIFTGKRVTSEVVAQRIAICRRCDKHHAARSGLEWCGVSGHKVSEREGQSDNLAAFEEHLPQWGCKHPLRHDGKGWPNGAAGEGEAEGIVQLKEGDREPKAGKIAPPAAPVAPVPEPVSGGNAAPPHERKPEATPKKLILKTSLSPGDIVMLTAAVRDLHRCYPKQFITDVRTTGRQLWANNPHITQLDENDPSVEEVQCQYPLIHRSNEEPWHFVHGFIQYLNLRLGIQIRPTAFKGDIHLSPEEKRARSQVEEMVGKPVPFWIIVAGGKRDFTIKWWSHSRFQEVVDHFQDRILFAQVGEKGHEHPPLRGVLDLRGKTNLRQLIQLVYHSQGVLCPVTLLMHLAAAVETKPGMPKNRPCVVVAGGREPMQWEAYPHHQYIHTNGALMCCDNGGCWRSRTVPLGDGDTKDKPECLCVDVVKDEGKTSPPKETNKRPKQRNALAFPSEEWPALLPRCMDMITAEEVMRRVAFYHDGATVRYLTAQEAEVCKRITHKCGP